jgi:hypothetical protein
LTQVERRVEFTSNDAKDLSSVDLVLFCPFVLGNDVDGENVRGAEIRTEHAGGLGLGV